MKDKLKSKLRALKMLAEDAEGCMASPEEMVGAEAPVKATIMADSEEGLKEAAEKLPEILKKSKKLRKNLK